MIGIYSITNLKNNKVYVGSSIRIKDRCKGHLKKLSNNNHENSYLQRSFNKYGEKAFIFKILEKCNKNILLKRECFYIDKFNTLNRQYGYNLISPRYSIDYCNSEYINKLSKAKKGITPKNIEYCHKKQMRAIVEYENGDLIREYNSCKEAGYILNIDYKLINNVLRGMTKKVKKYPNKTWKYKKGITRNTVRKNSNTLIPIIKLNINGEFIKKYKNIHELLQENNITMLAVFNNCKNKTKICRKLNCKFKFDKNEC